MCSHHPDRTCLPARDLTRVALAVDALTVGADWPTLVHVDLGPDPLDQSSLIEIGLTPLPEASGLDDVMAALAGWRAPWTWNVVGVSTPASLRTVDSDGHERRHAAQVVYLIDRGGERVTRLAVPDAPRLSGTTDGFPADSPLDRSLRRVLGIGPRTQPHED